MTWRVLEFGESTNAIRVELNRLTNAKLLKSRVSGRVIEYEANTENTFFGDIEKVVKKYVGIDLLVINLINNLGQLERAYIVGDYSNGLDSGLIDLVLVGDVEELKVNRLVSKTEALINRKIRALILLPSELEKLSDRLEINNALVLWERN